MPIIDLNYPKVFVHRVSYGPWMHHDGQEAKPPPPGVPLYSWTDEGHALANDAFTTLSEAEARAGAEREQSKLTFELDALLGDVRVAWIMLRDHLHDLEQSNPGSVERGRAVHKAIRRGKLLNLRVEHLVGELEDGHN